MKQRVWLLVSSILLAATGQALASVPVSGAAPSLPEQIADFFTRLLDPTGFPARWRCGHWTSFHGWLYIASDLLIWAAYFTIPFLLIKFIRERRDMPFNRLFWLFGLFIFACGATHLLDAIIFWVPVYRLSGLVRLITAIASCGTVWALIRVLPEALLLRTPTELERIVQARTAELATANSQLRRTNTDLDNFIYTASHDLKTPIANIEGLLFMLRRQLPADALRAELVEPTLERMQDAVERFQLTLAQLTDISRLQQSQTPLSETVDLAVLIQAVCLDLALELDAAQGQLTVDAKDCPPVSFAPQHLRSIIYNLLSNAIKYHHPDRPPVVQLRCHVNERGIVLEVQDNGLGLTATQQTQLFGMFSRLHDHVPGSGIGLYMVKRIVENAGGTINVRSQPSVGSTFTVTLPQ